MANLNVSVWYIDSAQWTAVAAWAALTVAYPVGSLVRQAAAPAVGSERVFVQTNPTTHTSGAAEPTWVTTRYGATTDATCTWYECTGNPATNGDLTNAQTWAAQHASSTTVTAGLIIYDAGTASLQIVTTGGTIGGSSPGFSATAGTTTADNTATWTSLGAASNFQYWKAPHARLANSFAANWGAAGNTFYVGDDHAETQSTAITLTSPGTAASFCSIYCVDHTANAPPTSSNLKTTAAITTSSSSGTYSIVGFAYFYGISFNAGNISIKIGNTTISSLRFDSCIILLPLASGNAAAYIGNINANPCYVDLYNTVFNFGAAGNYIIFGGGLIKWRNTANAVAGTTPTVLIRNAIAAARGIMIIDGVDLSALGSGTTIVEAANIGNVQIINAKLGSSVTVAVTPTYEGAGVDLIVSDSGATGYRQERYQYQGTLTTSTTVYNGATDGVAPISWQVITTANSSRAFPFECFQIVQWVAAGTYTASVIQITSATASLLNSDVWVETEYLGNGSYPIASVVSSAPANLLTAGSSLAAGTWATGGLGHNYKLAVPSFTTALAGYVRFTVKVAKASLTVNIDPDVTVA